MIGDKAFLCNWGLKFLGPKTCESLIRRSVLMEWQGDELFKRRADPRQPSTAVFLSVMCRTYLSYQIVSFLIHCCSMLWAGVGVTPMLGLNKCLTELGFWKQKRRGRRKL